MMKQSQAEKLLREIDQVPELIREKLRVALVLSLGTDPTYCTEGQIDAELCLPEQGKPSVGPAQGKLGERMSRYVF